MAEDTVKVEHRPGQSIKLDRKAAEAFVRANPGARILDAEPEAKAVKATEVEDKAQRGPRAATARTARGRQAAQGKARAADDDADDDDADEDGD